MTEEAIVQLINKGNPEITKKLNTLFSLEFSSNVLIGDFHTCNSTNAEQIAKQLATLTHFMFDPVSLPAIDYFLRVGNIENLIQCEIVVIEPNTLQLHFKTPDLLEKIRCLYSLAIFIKKLDYVPVKFSAPTLFTPRMNHLGYITITSGSENITRENSYQYVGPCGKRALLIAKNRVTALTDFVSCESSKELIQKYNSTIKIMPLELRALISGLPFCVVSTDAVHTFVNDLCTDDKLCKVLIQFLSPIKIVNVSFKTNQIAKMRFLCKKGALFFATLKRSFFLQELSITINQDEYIVNIIGMENEAKKVSSLIEYNLNRLETHDFDCSIPLTTFDQIRSYDKIAEIIAIPQRFQNGIVKKFTLVGQKGEEFNLYAKELMRCQPSNDWKKDCFYTVLSISVARCIKAFEVEGLDQITYSFNKAKIIYPRIDPFSCFTYYNPTLHLKLRTSIVPTSYCKEDTPQVLFITSTSSGIEDVDVTELIERNILNPFSNITFDSNTWFRISQNLYQHMYFNYKFSYDQFLELLKGIDHAIISPTLNITIHAIILIKSRELIKNIEVSLSKQLVEIVIKHPEYIMHSSMKNWSFIPVTLADYPYLPYSSKRVDVATMMHSPAKVYRTLPKVNCGVILDKNFKGITTGSFIPETESIFKFDFSSLFGSYPPALKLHAQNMLRLYMEPDLVSGKGKLCKDIEYELYQFCEKMMALFNSIIYSIPPELTNEFDIARLQMKEQGTLRHVFWDCYDTQLIDLLEKVGFSVLIHLNSIEVHFPDRMRQIKGYLFTPEKRISDSQKWVEADILVDETDMFANPYVFFAVKTPLHIIKYTIHSSN
ncbi:hypothetical protein EDI_112090 [Entamoeba dispar SAW760]|uniref:Uncharacterized protein n=1 Tax=Entamoeba dispar (strain ATCC PRA-260 / SAW760) TaxID=370354 RepID=B0E6E9_ENTDS|nr:uncharacterized protein EDI_112090 [Entamoeba dispar SAW760]EDR29907.1 hypothetical protein EDI_112090 [Entamoeba dispar SAW760]|eukprot:EDR29907.1 hypothetical protein EDI_112090 [Entamoeba dispar SAW760]